MRVLSIINIRDVYIGTIIALVTVITHVGVSIRGGASSNRDCFVGGRLGSEVVAIVIQVLTHEREDWPCVAVLPDERVVFLDLAKG